MNQPIEEKWKEEFDKKFTAEEMEPDYSNVVIAEPFELKSFIENLLEQERQRMSEALTVNLDTSVMLDGWEKYWIDAENGRYIEGCVECGNSTRIKKAIINK